jgi:hypothetical protein
MEALPLKRPTATNRGVKLTRNCRGPYCSPPIVAIGLDRARGIIGQLLLHKNPVASGRATVYSKEGCVVRLLPGDKKFGPWPFPKFLLPISKL